MPPLEASRSMGPRRTSPRSYAEPAVRAALPDSRFDATMGAPVRSNPEGGRMAQLDMFSLEGRVALIPGGGGRSVGRWRRPLRRRAPAAVAGRTADTLQTAVDRVVAAGSEGLAIEGDATDEADAERMVRETVDRFGRIDIVVNGCRWWAGKVLHPAEGIHATRGLHHGAQRPQHPHPDAGGGSRDDPARRGRCDPEHHVGPRRALHQRGLLGLRRGEGCHRLPNSPVGDRMGEARHPGQRHHADLRRHAAGRHAARRPGLQGGYREFRSRSGASARRATSSARPSSSPTRPRS